MRCELVQKVFVGSLSGDELVIFQGFLFLTTIIKLLCVK